MPVVQMDSTLSLSVEVFWLDEQEAALGTVASFRNV